MAAGLAVAAVVTLIAVLLPGVLVRATPVPRLRRPTTRSGCRTIATPHRRGSGRPVPGFRPQLAGTDRSHLRYLTVQLWKSFGFLISVGTFVLAGLVGTLVWRRRRRRVSKAVTSGSEDIGAECGAGTGAVVGEGTAGE